MTLTKSVPVYQSIPNDLHDTFFFKSMVQLTNDLADSQDLRNKVKSGLFYTFRIEGQTGLAESLNESVMEAFSEMGAGASYVLNPSHGFVATDEVLEVTRKYKWAQYKAEGDFEMMEREKSLEEIIMQALEKAETDYKFGREIRTKRDAERAR